MSLRRVDDRLRVNQIITGVFTVTQGLFVVMSYVATEGNTEPESLDMAMLAGFSGAAFGAAVLSIASRVKTLGGLGLALLTRPDLSSADPVSDAELEEALQTTLARYQSGQVISLVFAEMTTLFGFALAYLHGAWPLMVPYALAGAGLCALMFPSRAALISLLPPGARAALQA